jgi:hypothetical protein
MKKNRNMQARASELRQIAEVMQEYGISSPLALEMFSIVATNQGNSLPMILGLESTDSEFKRCYGAIRRMSSGDRGPGSGSGLIQADSERTNGNEKALWLTEKGRRCAEQLGLI